MKGVNSVIRGNYLRNHFEFFSALLMAFATVASAWCGYQSTRWNGKQSILMSEVAALRSEATQKLNLAGQEAIIDINMFEQFHRAMIEGRTETAQKILRRFRPEAKVAVDAWLAAGPFRNPDAPTGPFGMKEYRPKLADEAKVLNQQADTKFGQVREANSNVDRYTMLTVMFASVLFFGGLATHFTSVRVRVGDLMFGFLVFLLTVAILIAMPRA
jgi:hypothetical protein